VKPQERTSPSSLPLRIAVVMAIGAMMSAVLLLAAGCGNDANTDTGPDAAVDPDPLDITDTAAAGSLDDVHQRIIAKRCSGQPGLCHNGQFEPNLSTPANTYAYLVNRPGIEHANELRVKPGDSAHSLFIDKLRNRGVATQMPLGAQPLDEADIVALEMWIDQGALRAPGAMPAPVLNNPPKRPEIGIFNGTTRLDGTGPVRVSAGTPLIIRHTVADFETPDAMIPFGGILLTAADGRSVVLDPSNTSNPSFGVTSYDAAGPMGNGDQFDFKRAWTVPNPLPLLDKSTNTTTNVSPSGQVLTVLAVYVDQLTNGIAAFDISTTTIEIQ
jgi:hypothetical protein